MDILSLGKSETITNAWVAKVIVLDGMNEPRPATVLIAYEGFWNKWSAMFYVEHDPSIELHWSTSASGPTMLNTFKKFRTAVELREKANRMMAANGPRPAIRCPHCERYDNRFNRGWQRDDDKQIFHEYYCSPCREFFSVAAMSTNIYKPANVE